MYESEISLPIAILRSQSDLGIKSDPIEMAHYAALITHDYSQSYIDSMVELFENLIKSNQNP